MNHNDIMDTVHRKIDKEKILISAAIAMRQSSNPQVQQSLDAQIKEGRKNIGYLEERLKELEMRRMGQGMGSMSVGSSSNGRPPPPMHGNQQNPRNNSFGPPNPVGNQGRGGYRADQGDYGNPPPGGYQEQMGAGSGIMLPRPPYGPQAPVGAMPKARPNYSKLGKYSAEREAEALTRSIQI